MIEEPDIQKLQRQLTKHSSDPRDLPQYPQAHMRFHRRMDVGTLDSVIIALVLVTGAMAVKPAIEKISAAITYANCTYVSDCTTQYTQ